MDSGFHDAHTNLPARGLASTNLLARSPTLRTYPPVVQHMWSSSYVPPRTQHLSTMSTEHTNLPRSYPHRRVIEYEPPRSYHHMLSPFTLDFRLHQNPSNYPNFPFYMVLNYG